MREGEEEREGKVPVLTVNVRRKRMRVRSVQRRNDHKKYRHTRPTRDASRVDPRHLSLAPTGIDMRGGESKWRERKEMLY